MLTLTELMVIIHGNVPAARKYGIYAFEALHRVFPGGPTHSSRSWSPAGIPAEDHALYPDRLPACPNPFHPVNPVKKMP
jgi:hypothetical protein